MTRVGLISDTHNHLDPRVAKAFADVDRILHAGDACSPAVLYEIQALGKPLDAVKGNCDTFDLPDLPEVLALRIEGKRVVLVHDRWFVHPVNGEETDIVVFGHSHVPAVTEVDGVLWVNPGSATQPRRSAIGKSVAILEIAEKGAPTATIVALDALGE